jgi:phosphoglycerate dehydrogenase-like enzyme
MSKGTIFVCRDIHLEKQLDDVVACLEERGFTVLRGEMPSLGIRRRFTDQDRAGPLAEADIVVISSRNALAPEDIAAACKLRGIMTPTIGVDMIDMAAVDRAGILVGHGAMPENFLSMAEATVMLLTVLFYQLHRTERHLREPLPRPTEQFARMLRGATIGLIGFGRIGRAVHARLAGWDVTTLVSAPSLTQADVPADVRLVDLDTLLRQSDAVSLHVTLNATTRNLIDERALRMMKASAYLVNTARGAVIDEPALIRALNEGWIAGAALDTVVNEPLPADSPLRDLPNLILTPHMVGHTQQIFEAMGPALLENIVRVMRGELPLYCKNPQAEGIWRRRLAHLAELEAGRGL